MRLYLVRHGQSEGNVNSAAGADCTLTPYGEEQAFLVAQFLAALPITTLYSSPYRRTITTARRIAASLKLPLKLLPSAHEHHAVRPPGWIPPSRSALEERYPDLPIAEDISEEGWLPLPETAEQVHERMQRLFHWLSSHHSPEDGIVVVSHASPIQQLIAAASGRYTWAQATTLAIGNASVSTLVCDSLSIVLESTGRDDFLRVEQPALL
ncbi:MAG: histidine phosphatase family protein [Chloroflexi bacterium]|nr:histidine phosphatase family protein [Chloroflexota bacterium]